MAEEKTVVERYRKSPFVLDKPKLARMLDIMEQRFAEAQLDFKPTFGITLKKGRQIKTRSMDQLLGFDNSVSNPITGLVIIADSYSGGPPEKNLFAKLDFDNTSRPIISLEVISSDSKRAAQSFAELARGTGRTNTRHDMDAQNQCKYLSLRFWHSVSCIHIHGNSVLAK
jgi:hypothetical protein